MRAAAGTVDLFWLPLGAGGWFVRRNGRAFEAVLARLEQRPALDLYHSALEVRVDGRRTVVEQTAVPRGRPEERGVVGQGPVAVRALGRLRVFRYEVRAWEDGTIPDVGEAVGSPVRLSADAPSARRLLALTRRVPLLVWGRDELRAGEMWNSNSIVAWLVARAGIATGGIRPPPGGRAPGWRAGLVAAARESGPTGG